MPEPLNPNDGRVEKKMVTGSSFYFIQLGFWEAFLVWMKSVVVVMLLKLRARCLRVQQARVCGAAVLIGRHQSPTSEQAKNRLRSIFGKLSDSKEASGGTAALLVGKQLMTSSPVSSLCDRSYSNFDSCLVMVCS